MLTAATVPSMGLTIVPWARFCWAAVTFAWAASTAAWSATSSAEDGPDDDADAEDGAADDCVGACDVEPLDGAALVNCASSADSAWARLDSADATFCWASRDVCRSLTHCGDAPLCWGAVLVVVLPDDDVGWNVPLVDDAGDPLAVAQ